MDKLNIDKKLLEYNSIIKENDRLYHEAAKTFGLPDCAFWILYVLRESDIKLTQSEICHAIYYPKQTVNSSLKKLETNGYIQLKQISNHRNKQIYLTPKGIQLSGMTVDKVMDIEHRALMELGNEEQEVFIRLFRKYTNILKNNMQKLTKD